MARAPAASFARKSPLAISVRAQGSEAALSQLSLLFSRFSDGGEDGRCAVEPVLKRCRQNHGLGRSPLVSVPCQLGRQPLLTCHAGFQLPDLPLGVFPR